MLGDAYVEKQQWLEAESALKKSIELQPDLAPALFRPWRPALTKRKLSRSRRGFEEGVELTPDATSANTNWQKRIGPWAAGRKPRLWPRITVKALPDLAAAHVAPR